jgi:hypothetical protein
VAGTVIGMDRFESEIADRLTDETEEAVRDWLELGDDVQQAAVGALSVRLHELLTGRQVRLRSE